MFHKVRAPRPLGLKIGKLLGIGKIFDVAKEYTGITLVISIFFNIYHIIKE